MRERKCVAKESRGFANGFGFFFWLADVWASAAPKWIWFWVEKGFGLSGLECPLGLHLGF